MSGWGRALQAVIVLGCLLVIGGCAERPSAFQSLEHLFAAPQRVEPSPPAARPVEPTAATAAGQPPRAQFFPGTTQLIGGPRAAQAAIADGDVTLAFVNADVKDVVQTVLGDILGVPFVVDARAQGTVTLQTSQPIARDAVLPVLENVLRLNGFTLVRADNVYTVVPSADASRLAPALRAGAAAAGYTVQVVPLRYAGAEELLAVLRSVVPPDALLRSVPQRNVLIVGGTSRELAGLLDLVALFDVDWLAGTSYALFYPRIVDAKTLTKELDAVFASDRGPGAGLIRFMPMERLNAVLAMSRVPGHLEKAEQWVERLDQGSEVADERIFVYYVQNGRAADLAATLNRLLVGASPLDAATAGTIGRVVEFPPEPVAPPAASAPAPGGARPAERRDAPPATAASGPADSEGIRLGGRIAPRIIADEPNNALLVLTTPREYRVIEAALAKLDIAPLQVLIEAVVAEVTLTDLLRYGVQWRFLPGSTSITLSEASSGAVASTFPGFSVLTTAGNNNIQVVLNALESITKVNVLSSPQLMVLNNQTATLQVGDQVPIATQSAVSTTVAGAPVVNTIQFRDTGVILKVTPRVNEGGLVLMDISQEVSDVTRTTTSNIDSPTIQQRKINSAVSVRSGETIALGGLIRDRRTDTTSGVPVLKDIPVLGHLFKSNSDTGTRTELVVLITPRTVRSPADINRVTQEFRDRLRSFAAPRN